MNEELNITKPEKINAFEKPIPEIKEVFNDKKVGEYIEGTISNVLGHLGIPEEESKKIVKQCLENAKSYKLVSDYELNTHKIFEDAGVNIEIPKKLTGRADLIFKQIKPYLIPGSVLDLGSGDGKVGERCAKNGHDVQLADVYKNPNIDKTGLDFKQFKQGEPIPVDDNMYDNTLALTVFHHSSDPIGTIKESYRVTKPNGRVIVIESVYGVSGDDLPAEEKEKIKAFLDLNEEQQRLANVFFDHFYNRVIHYSDNPDTKVNVPFNFNTPDKWKEIFENEGFEQKNVIHLGSDQPTVPEYHTLHVLKKIEK